MPLSAMAESRGFYSYNYFEGGNSQRNSMASDRDQYEDDPPQQAGENFKPKRDRIWYADWTRALAI